MAYIDKDKFRIHIIMYQNNLLKVKLTDKEKEKFIRILDEAPTADVPERHVGKWIPVTERLPEKNGRYLVTRGLSACGDMWNRVYIINYSDLMGLKSKRIWWYGNVGKSDFVRVEDVIAWMPLPEPYREEANNAQLD